MLKPFQAFMTEIIDYAGLFPPAKLEMDPAIRNYAEYRSGIVSWMLSRFICPASRLTELAAYKESLFEGDQPFRFSVLGSRSKSETEFFATLKKDLAAIEQFRALHGENVITDVYETRFPEALQKSPTSTAVKSFLDKAASIIEEQGPPEFKVFYEMGFHEEWEMQFPAVLRGISQHNEAGEESDQQQKYAGAGLKLRCGGVEPHMYPSVDQLAHAISLGRDNRVAIKATAGLHHPVRHLNPVDKIKMHGFFNVFGAGVFAYAHDLNREELREIIGDEDPKNFLFTAKAFAWKTLRVSTGEIEKIRKAGIISFGSCSFDEPKDDLRGLKLL
ncbi:MAG: hypothetical protein ACRBF0_09040 [Calditrichia bacterium]